ncbi:MAG TPA: hypothetical protein VIX41_03525 [Acidimicrobiales bacterium]
MGLDNIPHRYPCAVVGTAIRTLDDDGGQRIDCNATMAADCCPWQTASRDAGSPTYGMLGVPCWFRGKSGNWMLEELTAIGHTPPGDFYGTKDQEEPGPHLDPEFCTTLSKWMADHAEVYASLHRGDDDGGKDAVDGYRYAAWWLGFVARSAEGSDTWY